MRPERIHSKSRERRWGFVLGWQQYRQKVRGPSVFDYFRADRIAADLMGDIKGREKRTPSLLDRATGRMSLPPTGRGMTECH